MASGARSLAGENWRERASGYVFLDTYSVANTVVPLGRRKSVGEKAARMQFIILGRPLRQGCSNTRVGGIYFDHTLKAWVRLK